MDLNDYEILKLNLSLLSINNNFPSSINNSNNNIHNNINNNNINSNKIPLSEINQKLTKNSFKKSNSSLMCQIIYFLLISYNLEYIEELRTCYPVVTLSDLKLFKDTIYPILTSILPKKILCGRSVLDNGYGDKLILFLRNFSDFILEKKISNKNINNDNNNIINDDVINNGLNNNNDLEILNFKKKY